MFIVPWLWVVPFLCSRAETCTCLSLIGQDLVSSGQYKLILVNAIGHIVFPVFKEACTAHPQALCVSCSPLHGPAPLRMVQQ